MTPKKKDQDRELEEVLRALWQHENVLRDNRINWLIGVQGLLLTALALSDSRPLTLGIAVAGSMMAFSIAVALSKGSKATECFGEKWDKYVVDPVAPLAYRDGGPDWSPPRAADDESCSNESRSEALRSRLIRGLLPWKFLPWVFFVFWVVVASWSKSIEPRLGHPWVIAFDQDSNYVIEIEDAGEKRALGKDIRKMDAAYVLSDSEGITAIIPKERVLLIRRDP
ncbi:MAG: hypothetical protein AAF726_13555 [Planctomycetota bacterium]